MVFADCGGFGRNHGSRSGCGALALWLVTMDYVNYVYVNLCTIVIPAGGVGSLVMGGTAVTPIQLSL